MFSYIFILFNFYAFIPHTRALSTDEVVSLPNIDKLSTRTLAGHLLVDENYGNNLFYLFFESQRNASSDPIVIFFNGGPGTSSLFGCFVELGPYLFVNSTANEPISFVNNPYSWNREANLMFIDNPVGTGFSYTLSPDGYASTETQIAKELTNFLVGFFQLHPEYSHLPIYLFGESYAAKYVVWLASTVLELQDRIRSGSSRPTNNMVADEPALMKINMAAVAVGDGWIDSVQTSSYAPYLFLMGRIDETTLRASEKLYFTYQQAIQAKDYLKALALDNELLSNLAAQSQPPVLNQFDIRYSSDPTDPPYTRMVAWINSTTVRQALHTENHFFSDGSMAYSKLDPDEEQSALDRLSMLLSRPTALPTLLYNGQYDLMCNYMGTYDYARLVLWPGQSAFNNATFKPWSVASEEVGYYKTAQNLTFAVVFNAGHMSPFDQPRSLFDMLSRFLRSNF